MDNIQNYSITGTGLQVGVNHKVEFNKEQIVQILLIGIAAFCGARLIELTFAAILKVKAS